MSDLLVTILSDLLHSGGAEGNFVKTNFTHL